MKVRSSKVRAGAAAGWLLWPLLANGPAMAGSDPPSITYHLHCQGCHMEDGMGAVEIGRVPPLPGLAGHFLKHPKGRLYLCKVPGVVNAGLSPEITAEVLNYVLERYGAKELPAGWQPITGAEVERNWNTKVDDFTKLRAEIAADLAKDGIDLRY